VWRRIRAWSGCVCRVLAASAGSRSGVGQRHARPSPCDRQARLRARYLTLRALRVHLLWTCTLAAAVFTLIPVAPTWLFGLPAAAELFARVRRLLHHACAASTRSGQKRIAFGRCLHET